MSATLSIAIMDEFEKEALYRECYWRKNEFQLIQFDACDWHCQAEIAKLNRVMENVALSLGYIPAV